MKFKVLLSISTIIVFPVTVLAETEDVQRELLSNGITVQRVDEIDPVFSVMPAFALQNMLQK